MYLLLLKRNLYGKGTSITRRRRKISYLYSNNNITKFTSVFDFYYADEIPPLYAVLTWIFYKHDIFLKL